MRRVLPLLLLAGVAVGSAGATPPVVLVFDRSAATPHTVVRAHTGGRGVLKAARKRNLTVYLDSDPVAKLGRVLVNRKGNGALRFDVPNVVPGRYRVMLRGLRRPLPRQVGTFEVLDGPALRPCAQAVYGALAEDVVARSVTVGRIHLIGYNRNAAASPAWNGLALDRTTGEYATKVLLVVDRGAPVTLRVASEDRPRLALAYIPARFNRHRVTEGDAAVTFVPCGDAARTQFNGGFVFGEPLCAHFELVDGATTDDFALPLGRRCG